MAHKYNWNNATKLAKLVEALDDKALTFYSSLPEDGLGKLFPSQGQV